MSVSTAITIDDALARRLIPERATGAHKWGVGGVLIVGGSPGYIGAPALAALGAGRSGAGIVTIASPRGSLGAIAAIVPEATFLPLPEGDLGIGGVRAAERLREKLERYRALVVGPGLGEDEYADAIMRGLTGLIEARPATLVGFSVRRSLSDELASGHDPIIGGEIPAVVDADGLNWLAKLDAWSDRLKPHSLVLTPHAGEMARLTGLATEEIVADPAAIARRFAAEWRQTIVLKGAPTVVASGDRLLAADAAPGALATAGSGDVFAGSIGAFIAQGLDPVDAAALAVWAGVRAAQRLSARLSPLGVVAGDLPVAIAESMASVMHHEER